MYISAREDLGEVGGPSVGLAPAIAAGGGIVITVGAVLEAIAFVLSAIAVAYLLIKAYEKAKSLGIGVEWAAQRLMNAMRRVVGEARKIIRELKRLLEEAGQQPPRPECQQALALLRERLGRIEEALRRYLAEPRTTIPRTPVEVELLKALEDSMYYIRPFMELLRNCLRA